MTIEFISAEQFTLQELTDLYNQTRVDYLVPMPMNASRLEEYIRDFDIALSQSCVARAGDGPMLGLCMLGIRPNRAWITRLGVLPATRRHGVGSALMDCMLENASRLGAKTTQLEVIKNNLPAYHLFSCKDFKEAGEYLVMRRAPYATPEPLRGDIHWLDSDRALEALQAYQYHLTWINALESMRNARDVEGLHLTLPDGSAGWLVYRNTKFTLRSTLSHLIIYTEQGNPIEVGTQLLLNLHTHYSHHDTYAENIHKDDPHLAAFQALGYFENFSRIEMFRSS
ncbi:MAG TPA: GNAT family N-acetyltransferase [Anaerolineales bacterium]|nr:GNAT family N-acetyltransferase [Anaerolineales bacterium]